MNEPFYYFGIFYVMYQIYVLMSVIIDKKDEDAEQFVENLEKSMPKDISGVGMNTINSNVDNLKKFTIKKLLSLIISLSFLSWLIIGWMYSQESNIFKAVIYTSIICLMVPIINIIIMSIKSKKFFLDAFGESVKKMEGTKFLVIIGIIDLAIKISAISFVVYNHFNIIQ